MLYMTNMQYEVQQKMNNTITEEELSELYQTKEYGSLDYEPKKPTYSETEYKHKLAQINKQIEKDYNAKTKEIEPLFLALLYVCGILWFFFFIFIII